MKFASFYFMKGTKVITLSLPDMSSSGSSLTTHAPLHWKVKGAFLKAVRITH